MQGRNILENENHQNKNFVERVGVFKRNGGNSHVLCTSL